ncbi:hypothetical protein CHISP_1545 [Chitinispirillum alkaliphilum]|nr:hypothetical protein CHISP_1545 [Chitinispirillum alkaliphilum]
MTILIKFISLPLYPLGLVITILLAALLLPAGFTKLRRTLSVVAVVMLYLFSTPPVSRLLVRGLENRYEQRLPREGKNLPIVVLGGGGSPLFSTDHYPEINQAGDRILHGARLYQQGVSDLIIPTGGGIWLKNRVSEAHHYEMLLSGVLGVNPSDIVTESLSRNTYEHAPNVAQILDSLNLPHEIILVTSASHMPRSVAVFRNYGYTVYTAPIDYYGRGELLRSPTEFFPRASALELSTRAIHEYYGFVGYWLLGWI